MTANQISFVLVQYEYELYLLLKSALKKFRPQWESNPGTSNPGHGALTIFILVVPLKLE